MRIGRQRRWTLLVALSIGALAFVYRFNTLGGPLAGFDNDHFFQIVRADAMLDGELPLRDYSDAELRSIWPPLSYATSAVAMKAMGRSLRSEAVLTAAMLAFGAAALFWTAASIGGSILAAALAALLAVGLAPTLYNYPKIVPYVLAVAAMLAYARRPNTLRRLGLAATVVVATLYRHDHGVYLGLSSLVLLALVHRQQVMRPLAGLAIFVLAGLTPGLVFVQQHGGVLAYLRECLETSRHEVGRTAAAPSFFQIDWSQPLLARVPPPPRARPRIGVRWAAAITPATRAAAERELSLADPDRRGSDPDDRSWSYTIDDPSSSHLEMIVRDTRVADTDGIDRQRFLLTSPPAAPPSRRGLSGWRVAPGLLREANAAVWLRLIAWGVVLGSVICLAWAPLRTSVTRPEVPVPALAAVSVLGVLLCVVFLRNPGAFRLPDVSVPVGVLGAWMLTAVPAAVRGRALALRMAVMTLLVVVVGLTVLSVGVVGEVREQIVGTGAADGAAGVEARWRQVWSTLGNLPESTEGIDESLGRAASYLRRCTRPDDRLLVADNLPEVNYFARRGVAAGQLVFFGGFYTSTEAQRRTIAKWSRQPVPIALIEPAERFSSEFGSDYPELAAYLRAHYRQAGHLEVRQGTMVDVWVDPRRDRGQRDPETNLPCVAH